MAVVGIPQYLRLENAKDHCRQVCVICGHLLTLAEPIKKAEKCLCPGRPFPDLDSHLVAVIGDRFTTSQGSVC